MTLDVTPYIVPGTTYPTFVDSSMLGAYKSCPRKFYYQYLRHLRGSETSIHLVAGGAFAAALETVRLLLWSPEPPPFEDAIHAGRLTAIKHFENHDFEGENKDLPNILLAIEDYFLHFGVHDDPIQPFMRSNGKPAVEFSFAMPTGIPHPETGEDILYVGRFDMVGERSIGGKKQLFAVDEKTTGQLGPSWQKSWDLRSQFTGYCWAAQEHGYPVGGAIVRGMSFLKKSFGFAEVITYRAAHEIDAWKATTRDIIMQTIRDWESGIFYQNFDSACTSYSGCPYTLLCKTRDPERWVEANFVEVPWNPMEG